MAARCSGRSDYDEDSGPAGDRVARARSNMRAGRYKITAVQIRGWLGRPAGSGRLAFTGLTKQLPVLEDVANDFPLGSIAEVL
jgi:hypothetical protein